MTDNNAELGNSGEFSARHIGPAEKEQKQMLNESCTCYTQNPVSGGPALVYYTCAGQSGNATVAASCSS